MSPYTPNDTFTQPETYDLSDLVKGGSDGDANVPIEALYDQTNYLKNRLHRWEDVKVISDNYSFDPADIGKWLEFHISANKTFTLPDVGSLPAGTRIGVKTVIPAIKSLTVQAFAQSQSIIDGTTSWVKWDDNTFPAMYMHDRESLILIACGDHWSVESGIGNFYTAGDSYGARSQRGNTVIADGTIYDRADMPRVALYAQSLGDGYVTDGFWLSDPQSKPVYRGMFSQGDGANTIRVPDERGLSDRYMDLGRGLDTNRQLNIAGCFEDEQVATHDHLTHGQGKIPSQNPITGGYLNISDTPITGRRYSGGGQDPFGLGAVPDTNMKTSKNSGAQNIVKNVGKIPLINY